MLIESMLNPFEVELVLKSLFVCLTGFLFPLIFMVLVYKMISKYIDPFEGNLRVAFDQAKLYDSLMDKKERNRMRIFTIVGIVVPSLLLINVTINYYSFSIITSVLYICAIFIAMVGISLIVFKPSIVALFIMTLGFDFAVLAFLTPFLYLSSAYGGYFGTLYGCFAVAGVCLGIHPILKTLTKNGFFESKTTNIK